MKNEDIVIRAYNEAADLERLSRIWLEASRIAHPFIGEARLLEQQALIETEYLPGAETWVACHRDEPAGFVSLLGTFVGGLFVDPARQGHGIGRALIAHALALKPELSLEVYTANTQACAFYAALGFRQVSARPFDDEGLPFANIRLHLKA